jgi:branched-chain amino acid transport system substrate-binding protein
MKKSKWLTLAALVMALSLVAVACGGDDDEGGTAGGDDGGDCTWQIGTIGALSGDAATIGQPIFKGIEYGVEQANATGDLPCELELVEQDSQGDPSQAPPLAQTLAQEENMVAVIGPYFSGETDATGDTFEEAGLPFLTPSATNPDLSGNGWTGFFRLVGTDAQQGQEAARFLAEVEGAQQVAIMHDNSEYGKPLADTVAGELGDAAVANVSINIEETDHSAALARVADADPDAVFFGGYQPEFSEILEQSANAGIDATFASGDGSKAVELASGEASQGAIVFCPCDDPAVSTNPEANQFAEDFEAAVGEAPGTYAIEGYDGVQMVAAALTDGGFDSGSDIAEIRESIKSFVADGTYEGLSKTFEFDDTGEIGTVSIYAYQVEGDGFKQLGLVSEL